MSPSTLIDLDRVRTALARYAPALLAPSSEQRRAAVAVILREAAAGVELLLIRRALREGDPWSGHMALPGGRQEAGDADELATARRETLEEVGLDLATAAMLGRLDDTQAVARARPVPMIIAAFVFELTSAPVLVLSGEVGEALWVPLADLLGTTLTTRIDYEVEGARYDLPGWNVQGNVVWGLTYRMLNLLIGAIEASASRGDL